jgi:hypothetical protein
MRAFTAVFNVFSKLRGSAYDAVRFMMAHLQNDRYKELAQNPDFFISREWVGEVQNLSYLENSTWVERIQFEIGFTYRDKIETDLVGDFLHTPTDMEDFLEHTMPGIDGEVKQ